MLYRRLLPTTLIAVAAAAAAATPAAAAPVDYEGATSAGTVVFLRDGDTVTDLSTYVSTACASSKTADTRAGADAVVLEQPVTIGAGEVEQTAKQDTLLSWGTADKTYRVTLTPGANGAVEGKIVMSYMMYEPHYNAWGYLDANTFVCQGEGTFTATPVAVEQPAVEQPAEEPAQKPKKAKKKHKKGKRAAAKHARG
ncbi:MAG TPA: hypothetical protein VIL49_15630 [Capillimicrobium sp.]|jgi:hypothetical protein